MKRRFKPRERKKGRKRKKDEDNELRESQKRDEERGDVPGRDRMTRGGYDRAGRGLK